MKHEIVLPFFLRFSGEGVIDNLTLAQSICAIMQEGLLIDIGCGSGLVSLYVAFHHPSVSVLAIDVNYQKCLDAHNTAKIANLHGRFRVVCGDAMKMYLPDAEAICCNPPLLPGEVGFLQEWAGEQVPFWVALVNHVSMLSCTPQIYLHMFDFHGISRATGAWPSLEQVALACGFQVTYLHRGVRYVGPFSRIRKTLPKLADYFPRGSLIVEGEAISFQTIVAQGIDFETPNMAIPHSVVLLKNERG